MARVIHMSETDTVLVDIRYPTRSITISDGIIAHTMPIPMRLELLSVPVPAGEVGVSDIMVGISQESWGYCFGKDGCQQLFNSKPKNVPWEVGRERLR